jgi:hypothetical protein
LSFVAYSWLSPLVECAQDISIDRVLVDLPIFHDHEKILGRVSDQLDVLQRVAVDQQQIRLGPPR